jgi:hypothetical protein
MKTSAGFSVPTFQVATINNFFISAITLTKILFASRPTCELPGLGFFQNDQAPKAPSYGKLAGGSQAPAGANFAAAKVD